jgi:peptidoglycan/LPS O-acetylase OafA/YrhL
MVAILGGGYGPANVLLANNLVGDDDVSSGRWQLWFIEGLVQIIIVLGALAMIPPLRRLDRRRPLVVPLALMAPALAIRAVGTSADDPARFFRPHLIAWVFLLGWAVQRAEGGRQRLAVSLVILAAVPGAFDDVVRETIVASGLLLLLWFPALTVPRPLSRVAGAVAAASLWIYLTHWQAWPVIAQLLPPSLAIPATVVTGVAAGAVADRLITGGGRSLRALREARRRGAFVRDAPDVLAGAEETARG